MQYSSLQTITDQYDCPKYRLQTFSESRSGGPLWAASSPLLGGNVPQQHVSVRQAEAGVGMGGGRRGEASRLEEA